MAPFIDPGEPALGRRSSLFEATGLMRFLMKRGVRVILFCKVSSLLKATGSDDDLLHLTVSKDV
jgi:DEAD/DEAH box helicase domain-containing protein